MKKIVTILLATAAIAGCSKGVKYTVTAADPMFEDGQYAYIIKEDSGKFVVIDSMLIANNAFTIKGNIEQPIEAYLGIGNGKDTQKRPMMQFFLEGGEINIAKSTPEQRMPAATGTALNDKMAEFNNLIGDLNKQIREAYQANDQAKAEQVEADMYKKAGEMMEANTDNIFGVYLLNNLHYQLKPQEVLDAIAKFPEALQPQFAEMKTQAETALKVQPGNPYVNITEKNAEGNDVTLESIVKTEGNKYVLLDFWASWCGPCMGELPYLKATYDAYHKKGFEIFGVSFDKDRDAWLKAVADNKMEWIHVSALKAWDNQARADYAVNSIPANFLIDCSNGQIIATSLRGEELQKKIAELLK